MALVRIVPRAQTSHLNLSEQLCAHYFSVCQQSAPAQFLMKHNFEMSSSYAWHFPLFTQSESTKASSSVTSLSIFRFASISHIKGDHLTLTEELQELLFAFFINILLGQHNQNTFSSLDGRGDFEACDWIFLATDYYCRMFAMFWQDFISRNFPSVTISAWPLMVLVGKSWKSFERVRSAVGKLASSSIWKCATFSLPHHTPHSALCFDSPCQNLDGCQHGHYTHTSRAERGKRLIAFEHAKRKQGRESMSFHGVFGAPFCGSREHKIIFIKISLGVKLHIARVGRSES